MTRLIKQTFLAAVENEKKETTAREECQQRSSGKVSTVGVAAVRTVASMTTLLDSITVGARSSGRERESWRSKLLFQQTTTAATTLFRSFCFLPSSFGSAALCVCARLTHTIASVRQALWSRGQDGVPRTILKNYNSIWLQF